MTKVFIARFIAVVLLISSLSVAAYATFQSSDNVDKNLVFSERTLLSGLWDSYKKKYWESSTGRTLDRQQNDITTSEGQSYTMLRAVWQDDKQTFDKAWEWTREHLGRDQNALFAWKWGKNTDGTYGVMTDQGGQNAATDADSDIALALIMAANKWQQQSYLDEAQVIVKDIWVNEVVQVNGRPYLAANDLEKNSQTRAIINPSYFSPYAYRIFAKVDKSHDWNALVSSSYELLNRSIESNLDKATSAKLVPDWFMLNKSNGEIAAIEGNGNLTTNYSYDAMRTPFRIALDYKWNGDARAKQTLEKLHFLDKQWNEKKKIISTYSHDGLVVKDDEVAEGYATSLGYFMVINPKSAEEIYDKKLRPLYDQNTNSWSQEMTYYADNWVWFGIALYDDKLENLAADLR